MTSVITDKDYAGFVTKIKERYLQTQLRVAFAANKEVIHFNWQLGKDIIYKQAETRWGSKFIKQLSHDLQNAFPGQEGFSVRNLERMRQFAKLYPVLDFAAQAVPQLPWGHIVILMQKIKEPKTREWYARNCLRHAISRPVLVHQIESKLYQRQGDEAPKISNFKSRLISPYSDMAQEILKSSYDLHVVGISNKAKEKDIENQLVHYIGKFLVELGSGFAFMGQQYRLTVGKETFVLDLLFYHVHLRRYFVIELKTVAFKPEFAGKLNFYLTSVDELLRHPDDQPTVGLLLCKSSDQTVAEYSLRNIDSPIGIANYKLIRKLPKEFKNELPSIELLESKVAEISDLIQKQKHDTP